LSSFASWDLSSWLLHLEQRLPQEIHLGLERIRLVADRLNLTRPQAKVITVAGTNGKGSTVYALERIYHEAGYRVGAYTSPHLILFNERIRFNLQPITDEALCAAFTLIEQARETIILSYFEMTTLAALWYFREQKVDVLLLEVGLGGRLDACNVIDPDLSIITTVDYDHQAFLGDTLEAIGFEKAGILRQGKPFIYADVNPPKTVLNEAFRLKVPLYLYGEDFSFEEKENDWSVFLPKQPLLQIPKPNLSLKAASAAILATRILQEDLAVSTSCLKSALRQMFIPGRLEWHQAEVNVLFDVSHNPQSVRRLSSFLQSLNVKGQIHAVFAALKDKDILKLILPLKDQVYYWYPTELDNKRALDALDLLDAFRKAEIPVESCYTSPPQAYAEARACAKPGDLIVVYGSFITVGQVIVYWSNNHEMGH
jgi:dihydrofolate synthase/folylpolyglutamate synthase